MSNESSNEICSCDVCKGMCIFPGIPTPDEAEKMLEAGLGDDLRPTESISVDADGDSWEILIPHSWMGCAFQDKENKLCLLHDLGLKPLECRLAHCKEEKWIHLDPTRKIQNREMIEFMWNTPKGKRILDRCCRHNNS